MAKLESLLALKRQFGPLSYAKNEVFKMYCGITSFCYASYNNDSCQVWLKLHKV